MKKLLKPSNFVIAGMTLVILFCMFCPVGQKIGRNIEKNGLRRTIFGPAKKPKAPVNPEPPVVIPVTPRALVLDKHYSGNERTEIEALSDFAVKHATWMESQGMHHSRFGQAANRYGAMAENIATAESWDDAYKMWRNSPGHWRNMSGGYKYMAFGNVGRSYVVIYASRDGSLSELETETVQVQQQPMIQMMPMQSSRRGFRQR